MKTMVRPVETVETTTKKNWMEPILQLLLNFAGMHIAYQVSVYVWRSMTGH